MKTLIITGASSGIGLATAKLFLEDDFQVVNISRRLCPLDEVHSIQCDLSQEDFVSQLEPALQPHLENSTRLSLIHNAAMYVNDSAVNAEIDVLRNALQINISAPHLLNKLCIPHMQPGSCILYVGSTLGEKAVSGCFTYVTTKHAQIGMMKALCQDLANTHIHTANICPGFTDTEMLRAHVPSDQLDNVAKLSTMGRLVEPEEIARCLKFVSENPSLNGAVIHANLGQVES
ncbi:MAG: SDR family NAD(P)-dependent oxidoreductase [Gammaproteobacteria bacterium]|nr:SDR family NAD(P)-dependent oxidoreductase [Gammaproteobacteria bacterium]